MQNVIANLTDSVNKAIATARQAQNVAGNAQAVAMAAGNATYFRHAPPPKYGNMKENAILGNGCPKLRLS